jgi:hypothetical protein
LNWTERYVFLVRAAAQADWQAIRRSQGLPFRVLQLENETDPERIVALTRQLIDALDAEENCG